MIQAVWTDRDRAGYGSARTGLGLGASRTGMAGAGPGGRIRPEASRPARAGSGRFRERSWLVWSGSAGSGWLGPA